MKDWRNYIPPDTQRDYLEAESVHCMDEMMAFYTCDPHNYETKEQLRQAVLDKRQEFLEHWLEQRGPYGQSTSKD